MTSFRISPQRYNVRLVNGRTTKEGRVEIKVRGEWGTICADHWTILEAAVACKHAGQGYAQSALPVSSLLLIRTYNRVTTGRGMLHSL